MSTLRSFPPRPAPRPNRYAVAWAPATTTSSTTGRGCEVSRGRCQLGWGSAGSGRAGAGWAGCRWYGSGCGSQSGDLVPDGESSGHFGAIVISGEPMAAGPEMRGDHAEHRQEPVGCAGGAEAFHGAFALPGRLVRVLRPVVQVPRLPVLDRRHHRPMRHRIASELVGDQHPRYPALLGQQLTEKTAWRPWHRGEVRPGCRGRCRPGRRPATDTADGR